MPSTTAHPLCPSLLMTLEEEMRAWCTYDLVRTGHMDMEDLKAEAKTLAI